MGFNLQLGDALRSESVTAIDDAIREIVRQEIARTPRSKFCESCAYMHQPEISARCCCVACHGDDVLAWAQRMNVTTPLSSEKTGEAHHQSHVAPPNSATASSPASPASEVKACADDEDEGACVSCGKPGECEDNQGDPYCHACMDRRIVSLLSEEQHEALVACGWTPPSRRAPAPSPASGESARTASKDASKELDELLAVFAKGDDDDEDCWTQPARRAQLYVASLRAEVERLEKRVTNLLSGTVESFEDGTLTILPHREMTTRMASALAGILDECEAPNYVQMILSRAGEPGEPRKRYVVTVQRPEGKTPHQLREDAEKERDALRAEVDRLRTEHARLIAVINDDGSLENIDDIVSIAEDAMHAYNVQNKLIEEVERLRAGVDVEAVVRDIQVPLFDAVNEYAAACRDNEGTTSVRRQLAVVAIIDALRTALAAQDSKEAK